MLINAIITFSVKKILCKVNFYVYCIKFQNMNTLKCKVRFPKSFNINDKLRNSKIKLNEKICLHCSDAFLSSRSTALYCSDSCRVMASKIKKKKNGGALRNTKLSKYEEAKLRYKRQKRVLDNELTIIRETAAINTAAAIMPLLNEKIKFEEQQKKNAKNGISELLDPFNSGLFDF